MTMRSAVLGAVLGAALALGILAIPVTTAEAGVARIVYTYQVRGLGNHSSLSTFAAQAAQTYADTRGWNLGGSIVFRRVSSGGSFTLWLAAASRVPSFGAPCDSGYSCTVGRNVVINETRWLSATSAWTGGGGSLRNYRHMVVNHETGHWLGFGHAHCGGAGQLAPVMQQQSISLQGCRFNAWPLPSERQRLASSRHVPIITGTPIGAFDSALPRLGSVAVRGWMIDPNTTASGRVHVYVGTHGYSLAANQYRPDVARAHPGYGPYHGFSARLYAAPGTRRVCAYAINLVGAGGTRSLGCKTVIVGGSPGGHLDSATATTGFVHVRGWAIDPDTAAAIRVHVYVDSLGVSVLADTARTDVAAAYPHYGAYHGFAATIGATTGSHRVCVYALNAAGSGNTVGLACRTVTVPPR